MTLLVSISHHALDSLYNLKKSYFFCTNNTLSYFVEGLERLQGVLS